jgi:hypothetical protein
MLQKRKLSVAIRASLAESTLMPRTIGIGANVALLARHGRRRALAAGLYKNGNR